MARIEKSIEIKVPPEGVWSYVTVPENFMKWSGTITNVEIIEEKDEGVGTTTRATLGKMEFIMEITEYVENKRISSRAIAGDLKKLAQSFTLDPIEEGTRFTYMIDYEVPKVIGGKILDVLMVRRTVEDEMERGLKRLKELLERSRLILEKAIGRGLQNFKNISEK